MDGIVLDCSNIVDEEQRTRTIKKLRDIGGPVGSISMGIKLTHGSIDATLDEYLSMADQSMYEQKQAHKRAQRVKGIGVGNKSNGCFLWLGSAHCFFARIIELGLTNISHECIVN